MTRVPCLHDEAWPPELPEIEFLIADVGRVRAALPPAPSRLGGRSGGLWERELGVVGWNPRLEAVSDGR